MKQYHLESTVNTITFFTFIHTKFNSRTIHTSVYAHARPCPHYTRVLRVTLNTYHSGT